ncbi:MAG: sigma-54-dependent Fis family transcriptional regulator [Deltaproteobacteria bacterium]|nr:sigma-54-dependent Fis family transcriptional regulator [Deltaproteobacteria bacterium]
MSSIVTSHPEMTKIFNTMEKVAGTASTVLILGDSGTGKELIARAIHDMSGRKGAFVPVNCGAIPDNLLESELFGYEKGAFTGAVTSKPGRFVLADGGTIFLDEIGEMSPQLQVKLLRVLQERVVESVGGIKGKAVNVRVIAATHKNLAEQVKIGAFREDLFYRLQVVPLRLPRLSERRSDLLPLCEHFSRKCAKNVGRRPLLFSSEVISTFERYPWPGNIRELENLIERLSILVDSDAVYPSDLPENVLAPQLAACGPVMPSVLPDGGLDFNTVIEEIENSLIRQALERTGGNKKAAAKLLRLNRTTLVEKIKKKGLLATDDARLADLDTDDTSGDGAAE